jgi:hypothetical protein
MHCGQNIVDTIFESFRLRSTDTYDLRPYSRIHFLPHQPWSVLGPNWMVGRTLLIRNNGDLLPRRRKDPGECAGEVGIGVER